MTGVNIDNGTTVIVTGVPDSGMTGTPLFTDVSNNQELFDLTSYFDTNTNIIVINTSFSTAYLGTTTSEIYFYTSCFSNVDGTGTSLTSTPELSIARKNLGVSASTDNLVIPINMVLKNGVNFDMTNKYLQIFVFATSTTTSTARILSNKIPVSIFSI